MLNKQESRQLKIFTALFLISLTWLGIRTYFRFTEIVPANNGQYAEALVGQPRYLNPILSPANEVDMDISRLIFSGLLKYDENQDIIPDLAERYELSSDRLTFTFYLRKDVKWHDETPFTADDVIFTIDSIQNPEFKSPLLPSFKGVAYDKVDNYTVRLGLKEPFTPFLSVLTTGILPKHLWSSINPANASLAQYNIKPVGTGPYMFKSLIKDENGRIKSYSFSPNKNYYKAKPYIEKITLKFYPDFESAIDAVKNRRVDGISFLPKELQNEFKKDKNINFYHLNFPQYTALFLNTDQNKFLKTKQIRQVLAYSINKTRIITEVLNQEAQPIASPILPGFLGHSDEIKKYDYDPQEALAILKKQGWTQDPISGILKKGGEELAIILTTVDQKEYVKTAQIIQENWEALGIKTNLEVIPATDIHKDKIKNRNYQILLYGEIVGYDPDPFPFWHSSQRQSPGLNLTNFANRDVDKILEEARTIPNNETKRADLYLEFQKIITEDIPAVFLYTPTYTYLVSDKIMGIDLTRISEPSDRFNDLASWYVKTKRVLK